MNQPLRHFSFALIALAVGLVLPTVAAAATTIEARTAPVRTEGGPAPGGFWNLWSNGRVGAPLRIAQPGPYQVSVRAYGSPAGGVWPEMALVVDGRRSGKSLSVDSGEPAEYRFEAELQPGVYEIAVAFLNDAVIGAEDRNLYLDRIVVAPPAGAAAPAPVDRREVVEAAEQRERRVLAEADAAIERHRKSDVVLRVIGPDGMPVAGAKATIEQTGHEFLFGCNIYRFDRFRDAAKNEPYKRRFEELFNAATLGFYWRSYEWERGKPQYDYTDRVVEWCRERGIRMKGHPLLWDYEPGMPRWTDGQAPPEIQKQRVFDIMTRYRGKIEFWEVVNEPSHLPGLKIDDPYRWAREADPDAHLIVNDYYVLADGQPNFFRLLQRAIDDGVPFDGIGIQAHEPRTMRFPLDRVRDILDHYATLGKALHITEYSPTSGGTPITGSHREGVWDEEAQAEYAAKFYRVCFAHPAMQAITWWDLCDDGSWLPGGGMLRADMTPKPVYEQLKRLIHQEWKTRISAESGADGRVALRGFHGAYRVTVEKDGRKAEASLTLRGAEPNEWTVTLP